MEQAFVIETQVFSTYSEKYDKLFDIINVFNNNTRKIKVIGIDLLGSRRIQK